MGEVALPTDTPRSILGNVLRLVVVLFYQHYDQLKNGLPWMEVHHGCLLCRDGGYSRHNVVPSRHVSVTTLCQMLSLS
jgi:hypothetical protein